MTVTNGAITSVKVGSTSYTLTSLPTTAVAGFTLSTYGTSLKLSTTISAAQLVTALGLSGTDVTNLVSYAVSGTALTLSVIVGANSTVTSTTAQAWGLGIGVDLSGSLGFNLLGLVGATVTLASGIGGGNYGNVARRAPGLHQLHKSTARTTTSTAGGSAGTDLGRAPKHHPHGDNCTPQTSGRPPLDRKRKPATDGRWPAGYPKSGIRPHSESWRLTMYEKLRTAREERLRTARVASPSSSCWSSL